MRTGIRVLGWILAVLAVALLARDLVVLAQSGAWAPIDVGPLWNALHPGSLQLAQPAIDFQILGAARGVVAHQLIGPGQVPKRWM